jgi:chromosome transmission fidelity protein 1
MSSSSESEIPFPFEPYPQQSILMNAIYSCIANGKVGIFESPTGTGKSLSVICSAIHWLKTEESRILLTAKQSNESTSTTTCDDWFAAITSQPSSDGDASLTRKVAGRLEEIDTRIKQASTNYSNKVRQAKSGVYSLGSSSLMAMMKKEQSGQAKPSTEPPDEGDAEFALSEYLSDDDAMCDDVDSSDDETDDILSEIPQIIYCSRTHSQISQFVSEIHKASYGSIRCITLGSRKQLCINESVNDGSRSDIHMTEKCLDMQKSKKDSKNKSQNGKLQKTTTNTSSSGCEYHNRTEEHRLAHITLGIPRNIHT